MKTGFIGTLFLCGMLLGCSSPAKNPHPKLLYSTPPVYPYYAQANRIEGDVTETIEEVGQKLFEFILDVASGRKKTFSDQWGLHNQLAVFNPAPVT